MFSSRRLFRSLQWVCHLPCYYTDWSDRVLTVSCGCWLFGLFSWSIAFVSLFIAATIASSVTKLPIEGIVQTMGLLTLPMIIVSVVGFFKILDFDLKNSDNRNIACLTIAANMSAVDTVFTQIFPRLYILTLIAAATLEVLFLWLYSKKGATYSNTSNDKEIISKKLAFKAFLPLIVGSIIVIIFSYPLKAIMAKTAFKLSLWGYAPPVLI